MIPSAPLLCTVFMHLHTILSQWPAALFSRKNSGLSGDRAPRRWHRPRRGYMEIEFKFDVTSRCSEYRWKEGRAECAGHWLGFPFQICERMIENGERLLTLISLKAQKVLTWYYKRFWMHYAPKTTQSYDRASTSFPSEPRVGKANKNPEANLLTSNFGFSFFWPLHF